MSAKIIYKKGDLIGVLIYLRDVDPKVLPSGKRARKALFECPYCKKPFTAFISNAKKEGHTTSCGCVTGKKIGDSHATHRKTRHPLYFTWHDMKNRCNNNNYKFFHRYGGRGISVCDKWKDDFNSFYNWALKNKWKKGLQIDRINNNGNYEPSNCRFVTGKVNIRNSTGAKLTTDLVRILKLTIKHSPQIPDSKLGEAFNISRVTVYDIRKGKTWKDIKV